jgi:hypothetical protein
VDNRTDFDANIIVAALQKYEFLQGKIAVEKYETLIRFGKNKGGTIVDEVLNIEFHKYLSLRMGDDYCEYFNTHWHPNDNKEAIEFLNDLANEKTIFYKNRLTRRHKIYFNVDSSKMKRLLKRKNKRFCVLFSAKQIYIDK